MLQRLVEKQIELGRIVLPEDALTGSPEASGGREVQTEAGAVEEAMQWLLAAHRGAGRSLPGSPVPAEPPAVAREQQAGQPAPADGGATEEQHAATPRRGPGCSTRGSLGPCCSITALEEEARLEQMRSISRSLWSTLSSGTASGTVACPASRAATDFAWQPEEVARMRSSGELDVRHHRRRDAQTRFLEASARDAALRRGSSAPKAG